MKSPSSQRCRHRLPFRRGFFRPWLERLEDRLAPAAGPSDVAADLMPPAPFANGALPAGIQSISWNGHQTYAHSGKWILSMAGTVGTATSQVASLQTQLDCLALNSQDIKVCYQLGQPGLFEIETSPTASFSDVYQTFCQMSGFRYLEPDFVLWADATPNDPSYSQLYGMNNTGQTGGTADADIDAPEAWNITTGSSSIVVGVIDTGVNWTHPDLAANIWTNPGEIPGNSIDDDGNGFIDDVHGYDFVNNDGDPMDDHGHGSHVSGTIGAVGNNSVGVVGVNWSVQIMGLKFLSAGGSGSTADAIRAVNYATLMKERGVNLKLTSNSWGGGGFSQALQDAIQANANAGMLFVAAAGNAAANNDLTPHYPSTYPVDNIIAVAATDHNDALASFSSYGLTTVDIGAPGVNTLSTWLGTGYNTISGTSMATPHVSGVAALLWSVAPSATYTQVMNAIYAGGDPKPSLSGKTVTGKRLNALGALQQLGMLVVSTTPAAGSIVATPPVDFVVDFSNPYVPSSVQASDLTVNGIAADSFLLTDTDTVTFHFGTSPVSAQGLQTMDIAASAILRLSDNAGVQVFTAQFRYDAVPLVVAATVPVDSSVVSLPLTSLRLMFNEPYQPSSIGTGDLTLNQGVVTGFNLIDALTVEYLVSGVTAEGTLTINVAAAALNDSFGNPGQAYAGSLILDYGTVAFPLPLRRVSPGGSLIYDPPVAGTIGFGADTDSFTINLDPGQTLTAVVTPSSGLRPQIDISGPGGSGSAPASVAGSAAVLQAVGIGVAGTYTVTVSSLDGTTGNYNLELTLNALVEDEEHDGPTNNTPGTAQNIDGSFIGLGGTGSRGAVVGRAEGGGTFTSSQTKNDVVFYPNVLTYDFSGLPSILGAGTLTVTANADLDLTTEYLHLDAEGIIVTDLFVTGGLQQSPVTTTVNLTQAQLLALAANGTISFTVTPSVDVNNLGPNSLTLALSFPTTPPTPDYYAFTLGAGESTVIALKTLAGGSATLELYDPSFNLLAIGNTGASNLDAYVRTQAVATAGNYYVRIGSTTGADYSLVVTKNADFDLEDNSSLAAGQVLGFSNAVLGSVGGQTFSGSGTPFAGATDFVGSPLAVGIAADGSFVGPTIGARWNGVEFLRYGTFLAGFTVRINGVNYTNMAAAGSTAYAVTLSNVSSGSRHTIRAVGTPVAGVTLERIVTWVDGDNHALVFTTITNNTAAALTNLALLDNQDPDPGSTTTTNNDVTASGRLVVGGSAAGAMGLGSLDSRAVVSAEGFTVTNPSDIIGSPVDPNGAAADIAINLAFNIGTLAAGTSTTATYAWVFGATQVAVESTFAAVGAQTVVDLDYYKFRVNAGDSLTIQTATPGSGPREPDNPLDPIIDLYDPSGTLITSNDNGAGDGRNAFLTHLASTTGVYTVRVRSVATTGDYVLRITGATGGSALFSVSTTNPANGALLRIVPTLLSVDFSSAVLASSVQASDLTIDGLAATGVTITDTDTVTFNLPAGLSEGTHSVAIDAGAILDGQSFPVTAYTGSFTIDTTPPRIISSSIQENDVLPTGSVSCAVNFNETMRVGNLDASDLTLQGLDRNLSYAPSSFSYNPAGTVLTINWNSLPDDRYTLTLLSGDGRFEDLVGLDLDGEPVTFPLPPNQTGNGTQGGNFVLHFAVDAGSVAFPTPLTAKAPLGSLIYDPVVTTYVSFAGDTDDITLALDASQTITVLATPGAGLQPQLTVRDPFGTLVGTVTGSGAGQVTILQTAPAATAGIYTISVTGAANSVGKADVRVYLNSALEAETYGGSGDNSRAAAQGLNGSFIGMGNGRGRAAVLGTTDGGAPLPTEQEPNNTTAAADNAMANFGVYSGNVYQLGLEGTLSSASDQDWYRLGILDVGDVLTISMSGAAANRGTMTDPSLFLYRNNGGSPIPVNSDNDSGPGVDALIWQFAVTATDTYFIRADKIGSATGTYDLGIWLQNAGAAPMNGGSVTTETEPNDTLVTATDVSTSWRPVRYYSLTGGTITSGDMDFYQYLFKAGDLVSVRGDSTSSLDARVSLLDAAGTVIASEDGTSVGPGVDSPIYSYLIPTTGVYYLQVRASSGTGSYNAEVFLSSSTPPPSAGTEDFYAFDLSANAKVTLVLTALTTAGLDMELQDSAGNVLATGSVGATNFDEIISEFGVTGAGTYYARVSGAPGVDYSLVVLRGADFDTEGNDTLPTAQGINNAKAALGWAGTADTDYYSVQLFAGQNVFISTRTPGGGPLEFINDLDPAIDLYDGGGNLLSSDDNNGGDGRNAQIVFSIVTTDTYILAVRSASGSGEYFVQINLTGNQAPTSNGLSTANVSEDAPPSVLSLASAFDDTEDLVTGLVFTVMGNTNPGLFSSVNLNNSPPQVTLVFAANANGSAALTIRAIDSGGLWVEDTLTVNVAPVNDAPVLDTSGTPALPSIPEDTLNPAGALVNTVLGGAVADVDAGALRGMAVIGVTGNGIWERSVNGTTWTLLGSVSPTAAVLLPSTTFIRFRPTTDFNGVATINYRAWDQTSFLTNTTINGGTTAFSTASETAVVIVTPVNDAPVLNATLSPVLAPIDEDATDPPGTAVGSLLVGAVADVDAEALRGIAVIGTSSTLDGIWQVSTTGGSNWEPLGPVSVIAARLLRDTDLLRFLPPTDFNGVVSITYRAWDQTSFQTNTTINGGTTAFSIIMETADLAIRPINDAPLLDSSGDLKLATIAEDPVTNIGTLVKDLLSSAGIDPVSDVDRGALEGIAVIGVDASQGTWQFSTDGGASWPQMGSPTATLARLLFADNLTRIRFTPALDFFGVVTAGIAFRAWDRSTGFNAGVANTTTNGNITPYSTASDTASIVVTSVPDAPRLDTAASPMLTPVPRNAANPEGEAVAAFLASVVQDPDPNSLGGVAITGTSAASKGTWQYSIDRGIHWVDFGLVTDATARLLRDTDLLRFKPATGYLGLADLDFRAWDQTSGTAGALVNLSAPGIVGGTTAFSANEDIVSIKVAMGLKTIKEDTRQPAGSAVQSIISFAFKAANPGAAKGIAVMGLTGTANGTWQYSLNGGLTWRSFGPTSASTALLLRTADQVRFVPAPNFHGAATIRYCAWNRSTGRQGRVVDLTLPGATGPSTAFSTDTDQSVVSVTSVNDRPVLNNSGSPTLVAGPNLVGNFANSAITDADAEAVKGIALIGLSGMTSGTWKISLNGGTFQSFTTPLSPTKAFLLRGTDAIMFVPNAGFTGTVRITFRAWDQTKGDAGQLVDATVGTAFSTKTETADLTV